MKPHKPMKPAKMTPQQRAFYQYLYTKAGRDHLRRVAAKIVSDTKRQCAGETKQE